MHRSIKEILQSIQYGKKKSYSLAKINIANGIFLQKELKIKSSYANESEEYYNSQAINVDFAKDGQATVDLINK